MWQTVCDMCKKVAHISNYDENEYWTVNFVQEGAPARKYKKYDFDLCPECAKKVLEFIKGENFND